MAFREIGPAVMGGRLDAVAGIPGNPRVIYLGHSSGGLYKSTDAGTTFAPIFHAGSSTAIGALALSPSDPNVVYAGTGEGFPRNTASPGDGIFRSADGGKNWRFVGLQASQHVAKIAVAPGEKTVFVAALGDEFRPGGMRGLYLSRNRGQTWSRVLYGNETTGASDVAIDPRDPRVVYAGMYDFLRRPWTFRSGGPGSGLYKSTDGGTHWMRLSDERHGFPSGAMDRVGVALCARDPNVVYAFAPNARGMLYRSSDAGAHWRMVNAHRDINFRPFYFSQLRVDPRNCKRVYSLAGGNSVSEDGGVTFKPFGGGGDNHDLWIDPADPARLLNGSDLGFDISLNRGKTWNHVNIIPFAQIYRVGFDLSVPYDVMAGMQDHEVWWGPNELWNGDGVDDGAWRRILGWSDGQYALADPRDADIIYETGHFGDVARLNMRTGDLRDISPQPYIAFGTAPTAFRHRFNWTAPLYRSPNNPDVLYYGGEVLFKSNDGGASWEAISPEFSPCAPELLARSGGPITHDNTNAETYCTIYSIAEDQFDPKRLWIGTDDGKLWTLRNGSWNHVDVPGVSAGARVSGIETSHRGSGSALVAFDRHGAGDDRPYVYETRDFGATWTNISGGLPSYVHVVREDPRNPDLLFAGTERGIWASFDRGRHWTSLMLGEAPVPVYDVQIQPAFNDLIVGTHGRGFLILDDLAPLENLTRAVAAGSALFTPMPAWRYQFRPSTDHGRGAFVAANKPAGAMISFYAAGPVAKREHAQIEIRDERGALVRRLETGVGAGINRTTWDLRADALGGKHVDQDARSSYVFYPLRIIGPRVLPGTYSVRLTLRGRTFAAPLQVRLDPHSRAGASDLQAQAQAIERINVQQERGEVMLHRIERLHAQAAALAKRPALSAALRNDLSGFNGDLAALADRLRNPDSGYREAARPVEQLAYLRYQIDQYDGPPTNAQAQAIDEFSGAIGDAESRSKELFGKRLDDLNAALRSAGIPALSP
jgi:photosystem II stability/assembly factor-like uncharacterized protein